MITCFKCWKILPGTLRPGEYVMCKECEEKWSSAKLTIDKDVLEGMVNELMKLKPFGWVFVPRMKDAITINIEHKEIVLCQDCKQWDEDGSYMGRGWCGWHMKSTGPWFFCADGEKEGEEQ